MTQTNQALADKFSFSSSIADNIWHLKSSSNPKGYEWFYFDAISDDGRDAVVIIFFDNFVFSPRYNSNRSNSKIPALAFFYYRDGKPVYRAINEFGEGDFVLENNSDCRLKNNSLHFKSTSYGNGFAIEINTNFQNNKRIEAKFEWLFIESDFCQSSEKNFEASHHWNLVAPRADVTGQIKILSKNLKNLGKIKFRGTGYHDHNFDSRWLPEIVDYWQWGRVHLPDKTVVFYHFKELGAIKPITKLYLICDAQLQQDDAIMSESQYKRNIFGIKYPENLEFVVGNDIKLKIKQVRAVDSSFFYLRFLSEMSLQIGDNPPLSAIGMTEHLAPKALKYRWLDWLINMRIGRKGKTAFLP